MCENKIGLLLRADNIPFYFHIGIFFFNFTVFAVVQENGLSVGSILLKKIINFFGNIKEKIPKE